MITKSTTRMLCMLLALFALTAVGQNWEEWRDELRVDALSQGIKPDVFDRAFAGVEPVKRVIDLDRSQPEDQLTFMHYRNTRIDAYRIRLGVSEFKKHRNQLMKIGKEFGVDPYIIIALWGVESGYGQFMGSYPVISSLATLAYDGRRSDFFRNELLIALQILNDQHVTLKDFKGEWAGASGHVQFLPSSWQKFAVDEDRDGRKNIWTSLDDSFASIANYLKSYGWVSGQPWGLEVVVPANFDRRAFATPQRLSISEWRKKGVRSAPGSQFPEQDYKADLVELYGGTVIMAFNNYYVIKKYNQSGFYAASVGYLADTIRKKVG